MVTSSVRINSRLPLLAAAVLLLFQIFSPSRAVMFMLVIILALLATGYVWVRQLSKGVYLERQRRYGWAQVGDTIEERWIMHNESWVPVLWAEIYEKSDLIGYNASRAVGFGIRQSIRWTTSGTCQRRGVYTLGPLTITMGDPFGLFTVQLLYNYVDTFVVYPPIAALPPLVTMRGSARGSGRANVRSPDLTTNAAAVREYAPGDALNRIHWRTTARRTTPENEDDFYVKEFDLEPSGDLWIILDMDARLHVGEGLESTEEYGVILAASLANQLLRENHAVGLITYDQKPIIIAPQKGHQQLWEVLRALSGVHAQSPLPLKDLMEMLEPAAGRGMSAAVITPSAEAGWIEGLTMLLRRGIHPTAILLDAQTFGADVDLRGIRNALADLGVPSHTIGKGFRFQQIVQRRHQRPEYKVLGTGRVIVVSPGEPASWVPVGGGKATES
ncbi:MAG: DUF58 domain-containing protein [Chloroflexi bacterium]|nr:DUF58 domain-containing protein [Chloroflexota bacterium]